MVKFIVMILLNFPSINIIVLWLFFNERTLSMLKEINIWYLEWPTNLRFQIITMYVELYFDNLTNLVCIELFYICQSELNSTVIGIIFFLEVVVLHIL